MQIKGGWQSQKCKVESADICQHKRVRYSHRVKNVRPMLLWSFLTFSLSSVLFGQLFSVLSVKLNKQNHVHSNQVSGHGCAPSDPISPAVDLSSRHPPSIIYNWTAFLKHAFTICIKDGRYVHVSLVQTYRKWLCIPQSQQKWRATPVSTDTFHSFNVSLLFSGNCGEEYFASFLSLWGLSFWGLIQF